MICMPQALASRACHDGCISNPSWQRQCDMVVAIMAHGITSNCGSSCGVCISHHPGNKLMHCVYLALEQHFMINCAE